jgi:hypothetical protein
MTDISIPTQLQPLISDDRLATQVWWRFFNALVQRTAATVPYLVATGIAATGNSQDTAFPLTAEWSQVEVVEAGTGVVLNDMGVGFDSRIWNLGVNALNVYPPFGGAIDALGDDMPYVLGVGKSQVFSQMSAVSFRSLSLE